VGLLSFDLLRQQALLLTDLTPEVLLALTQALLLLPGLCPAIIQERQTQGQHGIDVLGPPMHAWSLQTRVHHELVAAFYAPRANRPALLLVGRIVHQVTSLLLVVHLLGNLRVAPDKAAEVAQHPLWSVVFESVLDTVHPPRPGRCPPPSRTLSAISLTKSAACARVEDEPCTDP
jgi:hypothetical protein